MVGQAIGLRARSTPRPPSSLGHDSDLVPGGWLGHIVLPSTRAGRRPPQALQASFEEVSYLLWHGELPKPGELDRLAVELIAARAIPGELVQAFALMPRDTDPRLKIVQVAFSDCPFEIQIRATR